MSRVYNFSAGPATLPEPVLLKAQSEMLDYRGTGMSVMEMSHRSPLYMALYKDSIASLRKLLSIPDNYHVLYVHGGASLQFSMIPLNFMRTGEADFIDTGIWTKKAITEAQKFGKINVIASSEDKNYNYIPDFSEIKVSKNASYLHIASNNTIFGTEYQKLPATGDIPIVADMSSNFLSCPLNVKDYGLIFGGAQKNVGPSGLGVAVIRDDLLGYADETCPMLLNYKTYADNESMFNTPATYSIYIAKLVFEWLLDSGGLEAIDKTNQQKSDLLYQYIDESDFYKGTAQKESRSRMNVSFVLGDEKLNADFLREATESGLANLKGHRIAGGMRASIYNAMPLEGVKALVSFMKDFEKRKA